MLLANNHFTPIIGIDIHCTILPPPASIPGNPFHPYIGIVVDPFDYIPFIGSTVNINGIKRGNSTTQGIIIPLFHFSIFGGLFIKELPPAPFKTGESMNFFGSKNVYCEENRFTPKGFFTMTCNDIGIPLSLEPGKSWKSPIPSLFMPLAGSIPISYGDPVNVGPPYVPDFKAMIQDLVTSYGFGCLLKGVGNKVAESLKKLRKALGESSSKSSNKLGDLLCKLGFEPINLINGSVTYFGTDFEISSPFPIKWDRVWDSDNEFSGWLGYGVQCSYDRCVEIYEENNVIGLRLEDGRISAFPLLDIGEDFYNRTEKIKLTRHSDYYEALDYNTFNTYIFNSYNGKDKYRLSKIINKAGFSTHLHLDGDILTMIEDCAGRKIKAYTNSNGNILRLSLLTDEGEENLISYEYDYLGNMSAIIDALGQKTDIKYHQHLMIEKTDRNGQKFYWEYDGEATGARCIHTWGDGGWQEGWIEYHPDKGYNLVKDANGAITTYYYEPNQLVTEIKDPLGNSKFFEYTEFMEIYREIDEEGYMTGYTYDDFGNRTSIVYPDTTTAQSIYDEDQRLSISIDAEGHQTSYIYDDDHKYLIRSIIEPNNAITVFDYNELGLITTLRRENSESKLAYDEEHNLVSFEDDEGNITRWNYNHRGEVISIVSPENKTQSFTYDPLGRVVSIKNVENNITTLTYNAYDEVIEAKDPNHTIKFDYTPLGSLRMREENKSKVYFDYDKMEQLVGITNEHNERYSFLRNKAGHIVQETGFDGTTKQYTCNGNGWITRTNKEQDTWEEYQYDATGRIVRIDHNDGTWESFNYNKAGLLVECRNQDIDILLTRDKMGRVIKETQQYGYQKEECFSIISEYDKLGNRTQMTSTLGAEIQNQYDIRGLLSHIRANTSTHKENDNISWEAQIIRNKIGQEVERIVQGGLKIHHQYDALGRVAQHRVSRAGKDTYHRHYTWNANHQLKQTLDAITGGKTQFAYDAFGSLQSAQYQDGSYDYKMPDAVGNLYRSKDQTDRTYHKGGKLLHDEKYHYLYDPNGNLKLKTPRKVAQRQIDLRQEQLNAHKPKKFSFFVEEVPQHKTKDLDYYLRNDRIYTQAEKAEYKRLKAQENLQTLQDQQWQRGDWEYHWNANGSLKSVKLPDGEIVSYEYDALGRRTKKLVNGKIKRYLWDGNVLLHEWEYNVEEKPRRIVNKLGEVSFDKPEPVNNLITWVYETSSFVPCAKIVGNETFSIVNDYIGRPIQAYDNNGKLIWQTDYDIYGNLRNLQGNREFIPFRQLGQYEDIETGMYYNRFRYYNPETGTYISKDPIGLAGNNPNLYAYVFDSNTQIDILGLFLDKTHLHHTIPREIYNPRSGKPAMLPQHLVNDPDIKGKAGNPNRWRMPADEHIALHKKNRPGGDYNKRWAEELKKLEIKTPDKSKWTKDDILNIRDKLTKEFGIDKYKPCK